MNPHWRRLGTTLVATGFDPRRLLHALRFLPGYCRDLWRWRRATAAASGGFRLRIVPTLADRHASSGVARGHYFHQDLWVARLVHGAAPERHLDVGSRIDGFVAHLLSFREVEVVDIRRLESPVRGLRFHQADLMADEAPALAAAPSVSCLHALEHFGLGRYGDPLHPDGWRTGMANLARLVAPRGHLYLGVPIGVPTVEFNAQRIFDPRSIVDEALRHGLQLRRFAHVDDRGDMHEGQALPAPAAWAALARLDYGCGIFVFERTGATHPGAA